MNLVETRINMSISSGNNNLTRNLVDIFKFYISHVRLVGRNKTTHFKRRIARSTSPRG